MKHLSITDAETEGLGYNGIIIYKLIKEHNRELYRKLKAQNKLVELVGEWEDDYNQQMRTLIRSGLNESEAREIAWPEISARFGL